MVLRMCHKGLESADWSRLWELIHTPACALLLFTTATNCSEIWLISSTLASLGNIVLIGNDGTGVVKEMVPRGYAVLL